MADEERSGSCVVSGCPRDPYPRGDGTVPLLCGPHVSRLRSWLGDIPGYCDEVAGQSSPGEVVVVDEERRWPVKAGGEWMTAVERVRVASLPGALTPSRSRGGPISGTAEAPVPVDLDAVDLLAPARPAAAGVARRGDWWHTPGGDPDQVGHLPVAMELDGYVEALRDHRGRGEGRPDPDTAVLCRWLLVRLDEAVDDWPAVDEFFAKVRQLWAVLRAELGMYDGPEYMRSVPCPKCGLLALLRQPGSDFVTCSGCPAYLKITEYEEYKMTLATALSVEERQRRKRAAEDRRAVIRLLREMHAVGWRYGTRWQDETDPETGAPEGYRVHQWSRGDELIEVQLVDDEWYSALSYTPDPDALYGSGLIVGAGWVRTNGVKRLHQLTAAAGVLSVPKERAA